MTLIGVKRQRGAKIGVDDIHFDDEHPSIEVFDFEKQIPLLKTTFTEEAWDLVIDGNKFVLGNIVSYKLG